MEETRALLLATARDYFCRSGYADTSMDDLTASVDLTRGALYHHFGDKKGLFAAVAEQIDAQMNDRLQAITDNAADLWCGFRQRCHAYLEMALEPEYQQIILRDAKAVLGEALAKSNLQCIEQVENIMTELIRRKIVIHANPRALASLINGGLSEAAYWIAQENSNERLAQSIAAADILLDGLLRKKQENTAD
ncbi:MAG: TetR/AcrR family transcriptional regulator [Neisseria sp.]|nr:TetR/AcrR family transcriptional regulator [Neisseria sp.]